MPFQFLERFKQKQQAAAETGLAAYRRLIRKAVAKGDLTDPDEAGRLIALAAELGRNITLDADLIRQHDHLAAVAGSKGKLADELAKAEAANGQHKVETKRIIDELKAQQFALGIRAVQLRAELTDASNAEARVLQLRLDNAVLLGHEKPKAYLLHDRSERSVRDEFESVARNLRIAIADSFDTPTNERLRRSLAEHTERCERAVAHLRDQEKAIAKSGIHTCRVNSGSVEAVAAAWMREFDFVLAPMQSQTEFDELTALVRNAGRT